MALRATRVRNRDLNSDTSQSFVGEISAEMSDGETRSARRRRTPGPAQLPIQDDRRSGFTGSSDCGEMEADRAVLTRKQEEVRHPSHVWADPSYADEELDRLRQAYLDYCRGRAKPASPPTIRKYNQVLLSFIRSLTHYGESPVLASLTPTNVNRWVNERRGRGFSEDGIATHLIALKVFSSKYVYRELELTTSDLLRKVPRITPPEKPAQVLTEEERERLLACFDQPTFEDTRNRALIATYMATGLRFKEVLELPLDRLDRISGEITVLAKGGKQRPAKISPRAMKYVREYLRVRPRASSDRLWLTDRGQPLTYTGGQTIFRRLKKRSGIGRIRSHLLRHGFAQAALAKGAHPGMVQEMLGHSTPTMTRRYLGWAKQEEAARQMPDYAPI
jgi:site-specific recombinase XerD